MVIRTTTALIGVLMVASSVYGATKAVGLRTEYLTDPLGIDERHPGFSWRIESDRRGVLQTAYQIQVATSEKLLASGKPDMWDTGKKPSDACVQVRYAGKGLASRAAYFWRVRLASLKIRKPTTTLRRG